jgi:hypothetical protein
VSLVSVVCCQVEVSATGRQLLQGSPTDYMSLSVIGEPRRGGVSPPRPSSLEKKITNYPTTRR